MKEKWQVDVIENNFEKLCEKTTYNPKLLDDLVERKQITKEENEELQRIKDFEKFGVYKWKSKLYNILKTRENVYDILFEVLLNNGQTGAAKILDEQRENELRKEPSSKRSRLDENETKWTDHQLSNQDSKMISKEFLRDHKGFQSRWKDIFRNLNVPIDVIVQKMVDLEKETNPIEDIYTFSLEHWRSTEKENATVGKLVSILDRFHISDLADDLREEFDVSSEVIGKQEELTTWSNLDKASKAVLIERDITIKRRVTNFKTVFEELELSKRSLNIFLDKYLDDRMLAELYYDRNPIIFQETLPVKLQYYIDRKLLSRRQISKDIFQKNTEIFLVSGLGRHELSTLAGSEISDRSGRQAKQKRLTCRHILLEMKSDFEEICQKTDRPVHWLKSKSGTISWRQSRGDLKAVQKCISVDQEDISEADFLSKVDKLSHGPVCLTDTPGMGKSILLADLGRELRNKHPDRILIFTSLSSFIANLKIRQEINVYNLTELLLDQCSTTPLEFEIGRMLFKYKMVKVEVLFDGLDEVIPSDVTSALKCLKVVNSIPGVRLWVTTRPHYRSIVENTLQSLAYNIQPFHLEDQIHFLIQYWSQPSVSGGANLDRKKLTQFATVCLTKQKENMKDKKSSFAGVPLQCMLIAEVFAKDAVNCANPKNTKIEYLSPSISIETTKELFDQFVCTKIELYSKRYLQSRQLYLEEIKDFENSHMFHAMIAMFPDDCAKFKLKDPVELDTLLKVGLVETSGGKNSPEFIHRTFAEYFVAKFAHQVIQENCEWPLFVRKIFEIIKKDADHRNDAIREMHEGCGLMICSFRFPVVMYFLNCLIDPQTPFLTSSMEFSDNMIDDILCASACQSFSSIFQWLCTTPSFSKRVTLGPLFLSVFNAEWEVIEAVIKVYQQNDPTPLSSIRNEYEDFGFGENISLLHGAVARGNYLIFENLLKDHGFEEILRQPKTPLKFLLHHCVQSSGEEDDVVVTDKEEIITALVKLNKSLLEEQRRSMTPLVEPYIHFKLVSKLIFCGANVFHIDSIKESVFSKSASSSSSYQYDEIIRTIRVDSFQKFMSIANQSKVDDPLPLILNRLDPLESTLDYFSQNGYDFSRKTKHNQSLVTAAITNGRSENCVNKLISLGAPTNNIDNKGKNILHLAAWGNQTEMIKKIQQRI